MNKPLRIIPVLFIKNGLIVRSKNFNYHQIIGNVIEQAKRLSSWNVDELIYIDISRDEIYDLGRDDLSVKSMDSIKDIIEEISKSCFMPLTFGGKIKNVKDAVNLVRWGADKITINTLLMENKAEVKSIIKNLGSQAVVASVDYQYSNGEFYICRNFGKEITDIKLREFLKEIENLGVGEVFLQNIKNDGSAKGFDINIENQISFLKIPVILCSGAGNEEHFVNAAGIKNLSALAAGNYFNFKELSYPNVKKKLTKANIFVR
tara:strand:- start:45 stop:830 length:786 start_codon:yes stop_codon:yes gene_type:complete